MRALAGAGLVRLGTPRRFGGHEASLRTLLDVGAEAGEADGATSWVLTLVNACAWVVSLFPDRARADVFGADAQAKIAGALASTARAERMPGGYRVGGLAVRVGDRARELGAAGDPRGGARRTRDGARAGGRLRHRTHVGRRRHARHGQ
ncbi:hypothetical protein AB0K15_33955 [Amycolatopsis sp. NPDC049253]|uniref:hypothetical protein n=1 Tax=Amycolatopsis sp. NPDC049253 TaxID=3155274 RepID=UPI00341F08FA